MENTNLISKNDIKERFSAIKKNTFNFSLGLALTVASSMIMNIASNEYFETSESNRLYRQSEEFGSLRDGGNVMANVQYAFNCLEYVPGTFSVLSSGSDPKYPEPKQALTYVRKTLEIDLIKKSDSLITELKFIEALLDESTIYRNSCNKKIVFWLNLCF